MSVEFIFLFSLSNSGTTVISRYLARQTGGYLPPYGNNEGDQVPAVFLAMRARYKAPEVCYDWAFIRREWERLARRAGKTLFIEASPQDLLRADAVFEEFGPGMRAIFSVASPYSYVPSILYNYRDGPVTQDKLRGSARAWVNWARVLRDAIRDHPEVPRISYEAFCADPEVVNRALDLPVLSGGEIAGKGNERILGIRDQSRRQAAFLTAEEWDVVNEVLANHRPLLAFFGYEAVPGAALIADAQRDPGQFGAGRKRRETWGPRWRRLGLRQSLERVSIRVRARLLWLVRRPRRMPDATRRP